MSNRKGDSDMKSKEKELLIKDLCMRLPYRVKVKLDGIVMPQQLHWCHISTEEDWELPKPYLRPMSSMTEEEKTEFSVFIGNTERYIQQVCLDADSMINPIVGGYKCVYWGLLDKCIDWLNAHYFDYRGLIPMGLAIEASEGMYNN